MRNAQLHKDFLKSTLDTNKQFKILNFSSDTVPRPSQDMLEYAKSKINSLALDDHSTRQLETLCANIFGKSNALFVPTNTMGNQIALRILATQGAEVITHKRYHINFYESGASALAQINFNFLDTKDGILNNTDLETALHDKPRDRLYTQPELLWLENTMNYFAGDAYPLQTLKDNFAFCKKNNLKLYIDGARIFDALSALNLSPSEISRYYNGMCFSLSKHFGAYGSILLGDQTFIEKAKIMRKSLGGDMHNFGLLSQCGIYGLKHCMSYIKQTHKNTFALYQALKQYHDLLKIQKPQTKILILNLENTKFTADTFLRKCDEHNLKLLKWGYKKVRILLSFFNTEEEVEQCATIIKTILKAK